MFSLRSRRLFRVHFGKIEYDFHFELIFYGSLMASGEFPNCTRIRIRSILLRYIRLVVIILIMMMVIEFI